MKHADAGWREFWTETWFYSGIGTITLALLMVWTHGPIALALLVGAVCVAVAYRRDPALTLQPLDAVRGFVHTFSRRVWPVVVGLLLVAALVTSAFYAGRAGPEHQLTFTTEQDLFHAWAGLNLANVSLQHPAFAQVQGNMAVGQLYAAEAGLDALQRWRAIYTIVQDVQLAESNVLAHHATARDWQVLTIFHRSLLPYRNVGFGDLPLSTLDRVLNAAAARMGNGPG